MRFRPALPPIGEPDPCRPLGACHTSLQNLRVLVLIISGFCYHLRDEWHSCADLVSHTGFQGGSRDILGRSSSITVSELYLYVTVHAACPSQRTAAMGE